MTVTKSNPSASIEFILLALLTLSGCESCNDRTLPPTHEDDAKRFARAACMAEVNCGCGLYGSIEECETDLTAKFEYALSSGATVDEDCFEQYLESDVFQGCPPLPLTPDAVPECVALVGSAAQGDPCLPSSLLTMLRHQGCQAGLSCSLTGICGDSQPKQAGELCDPDFALSCDLDLYCNGAGTCVPRLSEGQNCSEALACELGLFCHGLVDGSGICTAQLGLGESCEPTELDSCGGPLDCHPATLQCSDMVPFVCVNLALP